MEALAWASKVQLIFSMTSTKISSRLPSVRLVDSTLLVTAAGAGPMRRPSRLWPGPPATETGSFSTKPRRASGGGSRWARVGVAVQRLAWVAVGTLPVP